MNKNEHIDFIRKNLNITHVAVSKYYSENKNEIENIKDIFILKDTKKEELLALLYLFTSDKNDDVIQKYCNITKLNYDFGSPQVTRHYKMLITGLIYNPTFYTMAVNYYGAISAGFNIGIVSSQPASDAEKQEKVQRIESDYVEHNNNVEYEVIQHNPSIIVIAWYKPILPRTLGAPKDFIEILKKPINFDNIKGNLYFWGNANKQVYLEFIFDEYHDGVPFEMEMRFTTTQDEEEYTIAIEKPIKDVVLGVKGIRSLIKSGIDSLGGIEANYEIRTKLFTK